MKPGSIFILLAALGCSTAVSAGVKDHDVIAHAIESGVVLAKPVSITFEWSRSLEGSNAREAADLLRSAKFVVSTSTTQLVEPAKVEYKLNAKWSGMLQEEQMRRIISRITEITAGQGSVNWQLSQTSP
jgi:hypothetical protein